MKYLLDTNTLSFAMAGDPSVCERPLSQARTDGLLPQPVVSEIEYGLARLRKSKRRDRLLRRFRAFLEEMPRAQRTDAVSLAFGVVKAELERRELGSRTSMSLSSPTRWRSMRPWSATTSLTCAAFQAFESRTGVGILPDRLL